MKLNLKKLAVAIGLSALLTASASALTLTINTGNGGLAGGLVGKIDPGTPANLANEVTYINTLLGLGSNVSNQSIGGRLYSTTAYDFTGTVTTTGALDYPDNPPISGPTGFTYVLGKYGNDSYVWFVGGQDFTMPSTVAGSGGLSHWAAFTPTGNNTPGVPDSGSTLVLLGLALTGAAFLRRRLA